MNRENDPKLWDLLGHRSEPEVSPFFSRNVVRKVRESQVRGRGRGWFSVRRLVPLGSVAAGLMAVFFLQMERDVTPVPESEVDLFANVDPQDYEVVSDLNDLLSFDENNSLDETIFR
jgi:hypothetical protein